MDLRVKALRNAELVGAAGVVTVTAPGAAVLVWDEEHCRALGEHSHSGMLGCRVDPLVAAEWNEQASGQWRRLNQRARQATVRYAAKHGVQGWSMSLRMWEYQSRGVLHVHVVLPMGTLNERLVSEFYARTLGSLAREHGFGHVHFGGKGTRGKRLPAMPAEQAARYLASYVAPYEKGTGKLSLTETVHHPQVPGHLLHVSRRLTQESGCTMRSLRRRRYAWRLARECERIEGQGNVSLITETLRHHGCPNYAYLVDYFDWWLRQPPSDP
jgi:hypothetical protein